MNTDWTNLIVSILAGLATAIPLLVELIKYIKTAVKEKNWSKVVTMVLDLMKVAESKFDKGTDKKEWVLAMMKASADTINFDLNMDEVAVLIDSLCDMSKVVNHRVTATAEVPSAI